MRVPGVAPVPRDLKAKLAEPYILARVTMYKPEQGTRSAEEDAAETEWRLRDN